MCSLYLEEHGDVVGIERLAGQLAQGLQQRVVCHRLLAEQLAHLESKPNQKQKQGNEARAMSENKDIM